MNVNAWKRTEIDLNECEHFLKANWDRSQIDLSSIVILVWVTLFYLKEHLK